VKNLFLPKLSRPLVVASVHSSAGLRLAARLRSRDVDVLELRADAFAGSEGPISKFLSEVELPVLLTVRHPAEGGIGNLSHGARKALFEKLLPHAALVDVELRSAVVMRSVVTEAKKRGILVVVSDHHFQRSPTLAQMRNRMRRAFAAGADIFKLAVRSDNAASLARLLDFVSTGKPRSLAVMGMGKFGMVSRLVLACAGSVLNYGYLDRPNASGQWEARELRKLLMQLGCRG
jgi:3-dehydroquinate dehydratase-1